MLPANYRIRLVEPSDYEAVIDICKRVYPTETPYTAEELEDHRQVYPQGQFVAIDEGRNAVAGVHFTLRLRMVDFHIDDSWDVLTAGGTFLDHDPAGHTLYGADIMVHPDHQHHGLGHALTDEARFLVQRERLWRLVGASRLPGFSKHAAMMSIDQYVGAVLDGALFDPVLTIHLKDGWTTVRPIHGYLQHDEDSAGWAEVIQWVNPECPPPPEFDLRKLSATRLDDYSITSAAIVSSGSPVAARESS
ncbi:MAG: GNAT family N-acetyltransferase [Planctomycetaceae bacterium]